MPPTTTTNVTTSTRSEPDGLPTTVPTKHRNHNNRNGNDNNYTDPRLSLRADLEAVDVKKNDVVGNEISGVMFKWVNYGKGWRPRWFVLQDGVLSYYKINGPDKIVVSEETDRGCKVIGEESIRIISKHRNKKQTASHRHLNRKPFGEVHLKVSSISVSKSDDRRFSIFTGTKRLHLWAKTREDRSAWVEALQAAKDMFPRMRNSELMTPLDEIVVSTDKLRQHLLEEGVREEAIQESEQIMRNESAALKNQLLLLKQKQRLLIDTLRRLEVHLMETRKKIQNSTTCADSTTIAK